MATKESKVVSAVDLPANKKFKEARSKKEK